MPYTKLTLCELTTMRAALGMPDARALEVILTQNDSNSSSATRPNPEDNETDLEVSPPQSTLYNWQMRRDVR